MTKEEAIKEIGEWYSGFSDKPSEKCIKMVIEELKKADQYRWHDLRKNPDDLPKVGMEVLVCAEDKGLKEKYYHMTQMAEASPYWITLTTDPYWVSPYLRMSPYLYFDGEIIAWREIEPFEEVEE